MHQKLDAFNSNKIAEVVAQAVQTGGYHKPYQKPSSSFSNTQPKLSNTNPFGKPYLGPPRDPQVTPGVDGSLNPALSCRYCKDTGHKVNNCAKVKCKEAMKAAAATQGSKNKEKLGGPGSGDRDLGQPPTYDPKQFIGKCIYDQADLDMLRSTVTCKPLSETDRFNIMEQAVAPCPKITMTIKGQKVCCLLDMGSEVTLMNESYFKQFIEKLTPAMEQDHLNAHKLFALRGVEDGCVPLSRYFSVDILVVGRVVHKVGILLKADHILLTDSKGKPTRAPAILRYNLIK